MQVLENSPEEDICSSSKSKSPVDINEDFLDGFSDSDSDCGDAEVCNCTVVWIVCLLI